ncbi:hypothetical protein [Pelagibaculum spongiae]|uniref:Uncharacterized protein n=1 Tax=Pelagibaculum spongiae TaxID=2080658 RepID=A0A2V1GQZ0_9GAMM|nr:hypothetical protein [Pelagibaculum spongiae]PVZ62979.1 hypothetical protein DC094_21675 [Pelagibaculum spongiae]
MNINGLLLSLLLVLTPLVVSAETVKEVAEPTSIAKKAQPPVKQKSAKSGDSGIRVQIQADQEAPQVLFVLPWKELNPNLQQVQFGPNKALDWKPLERDNFLQTLKIHKKITPKQ